MLIDDECSVLRVYGNTENILSPRAGEPTLKLTDLVPQQWAGHLHLSVQEALAEREPLTLTNLRDRVTGEDSMSVRLTPLQTSTGNVWDRLLVTFIREPHAFELSDANDQHAMRFGPDVAVEVDWKDQACTSREELEASREELQALNEELKASNEQLNESNEELNEANVRLQENIAQLAMQSRVLQSGAVMTLFLDQDLRLRWFTPAIREVFSLKSSDVGRSIADLVPRFDDRDFLKDIHDVLQAAMNGAPLETSLGILIRTLVSQADDDRRCAFYIADGNVLRHVVGMTASYAHCVDGFRISPESLACGLAVATGKPVITPDVLEEPRWQPWAWLAQQFGYRGCWSFPVETSEGNLVGSLAMYFEKPRAPSEVDLELATAFTQTAGIIIWRHLHSASSLQQPETSARTRVD
ncbi:MAG TPA: GAF domain-containing protein [Paraburkholderia sp.]|nr:GAF domain-containing protein [Paraburkholderia sp.]